MPREAKSRLRIGIVFDDTLDSVDGVAQYVKVLGGWLSREGHQVSYLVGQTETSEWVGDKIYSLSRNIRVSFNGNKVSVPLRADTKLIKGLLAGQRFDVLHVQMPYSPFMAQKVLRLAPETAKVATFHVFPAGRLSEYGSRLLGLWQRRNLRKLDKVLAVSPAAAGFAKRAFGIECEASSNVVDGRAFGTVKAENQPGHIVFLGRLVERKGCRQLIEAFALLSARLSDAHLTIGGDGPLRPELEALVRRKGLEDKVTFLGFIAEADKPALLGSAAVACFPSLYGESFGIVLIEAMAAGAGVVLGGDNPGYRTVLGERPKLLISPEYTASFADRLYELLTDTKLAAELKKWQTGRVKDFDVRIVGPKVVEAYKQAIAKKNESIDN